MWYSHSNKYTDENFALGVQLIVKLNPIDGVEFELNLSTEVPLP